MTLASTLTVDIDTLYIKALDLGNVSAPVSKRYRTTLPTGVATGAADKIFTDQRTITASSNEDLDLAGVLVDAFGATATFVKLKAIIIKAAAGNTNNVRVTRPASNGVPLFLAASDGIDVLPDGLFMWVAPGAGVTVTAATGDLINVANSSSGTSVTYDVIIIGTSA